jgi:mono/diheme cytochrome c family protein
VVRSPQSTHCLVVALFAALCLLSWGCDRAPSAEGLPEWKPSEHHSLDDDKMGDPRQGAPGAGSATAKGDDSTRLVEIAWQQNCVQCHGAMGRGDGQMGPMLHAPDLTQSKLSDADMVAIIKGGKNKMPSYAQMPDKVVTGLVARIHRLQGQGQEN